MGAAQAVLIGVDVFAVWNFKTCVAHTLEGGVNTTTTGAGSQTDVEYGFAGARSNGGFAHGKTNEVGRWDGFERAVARPSVLLHQVGTGDGHRHEITVCSPCDELAGGAGVGNADNGTRHLPTEQLQTATVVGQTSLSSAENRTSIVACHHSSPPLNSTPSSVI